MDEARGEKLAVMSAAFGGRSGAGTGGGGGSSDDWSRDRGEVFYRLQATEERQRVLEGEIKDELRGYRKEFAEHREEEAARMEAIRLAIAAVNTRVALMAGGAVLVIEVALRVVVPLVLRQL